MTDPIAPPAAAGPTHADRRLRAAAEALEAEFLTEMLTTAGVGRMPETFGGGPGEDQFRSFLVRAQADKMVKSGGIGLAESLFRALKARSE